MTRPTTANMSAGYPTSGLGPEIAARRSENSSRLGEVIE